MCKKKPVLSDDGSILCPECGEVLWECKSTMKVRCLDCKYSYDIVGIGVNMDV
jgi:predicted RNA-binding Zn-ribbon protein involved in translation (DUF1610 family)